MFEKVVVTGGAGFIGSHLIDLLLSRNYSIDVIDNLSTGRIENIKHFRDRVNFHNFDLSSSSDSISEIVDSADYVFHLASLADIVPSIKYPEIYFKANVEGTLNLLKLCNPKKLKKFVYAASSSCYGIAKKQTPLLKQVLSLQNIHMP